MIYRHAAWFLTARGARRADALEVASGVDRGGRHCWYVRIGATGPVLSAQPGLGADVREAVRHAHRTYPPAPWAPVWYVPWPTDVGLAPGEPLDLHAVVPGAGVPVALLADDVLWGWQTAEPATDCTGCEE